MTPPTKCPRCGSWKCGLQTYVTKAGRLQLFRDCVAKREGLKLARDRVAKT